MTREGQQEGGVVVTRVEENRQAAAINGGEVSWTVSRFVGVGVGVPHFGMFFGGEIVLVLKARGGPGGDRISLILCLVFATLSYGAADRRKEGNFWPGMMVPSKQEYFIAACTLPRPDALTPRQLG